MNPALSPPSNQRQKLEVRSWYLIGLACFVIALLAVGEYFAFHQPAAGELKSKADQQKTAAASGPSQIFGSHVSRTR